MTVLPEQVPRPATFGDEDLLPISALQHLLFCERQCALVHIEGLWAENRWTVEGRQLHEKAHDGPQEVRAGVTVTRGIPLRSDRLGLIGKADVVEFHPPSVPGGPAQPVPVEYKRGKPKAHDADRVQLCAQAMCLEEMFGAPVPRGALFYGRTRRREEVAFDDALRRLTRETAGRLHALIGSRRTPRAVRQAKCDRCSLLELCLPEALSPRRSASGYVARALADSLGEGIP